MSAVPPVQPVDRRTPNHAGFNDQSHTDPFLLSSTDEEYLLGAPSDASQIYHSHSTSASPQTSELSGVAIESVEAYPPAVFDLSTKSSSPFSTLNRNDLQFPQDHPTPNSCGSQGPTHERYLSPAIQISENGYTDTSEYAASAEFGEISELETDFDFLSYPVIQASSASAQASTHFKPSEPESATTNKSYDTNITQKISSGTATHSSLLMSPALTDRASPASRDGHYSPSSTAVYPLGASPDHQHAYRISDSKDPYFDAMQHTPTLTSSSKGTSPERTTRPHIARAASPVVRIESYSRGDSPARQSHLPGHKSGKRSRASRNPSHLMVHDDCGSSVDDEEDLAEEAQGYGSSVVSGMQLPHDRIGLDPQARINVSGTEVPNFQDQEESATVALRNADVAEWIQSNDGGGADVVNNPPPERPRRTSGTQRRRRARSTGDHILSKGNLQSLQEMPADIHIPGPGVLIDEVSGDDDDDDEDSVLMPSDEEEASEPPLLNAHGTQRPIDDIGFDEFEALNPPPLYRPKPWQDPVYDSSNPGVRMQPPTANSAMMLWKKQTDNTDALSRVATWGTRRMSEGDLSGLLHRFTFNKNEEAGRSRPGRPERQSSFLDQVRAKATRTGSLLKRSGSKNSRQQLSKATMPELSKEDSHGSRKESLGLPTTLQRVSSLGKRPKSPRVDTGNAVAALVSVASLGAGAAGPTSATATSPPATPFTSSRIETKRPRSRSELGNLWTKQGGPPMPTLAAPKEEGQAQSIIDQVGDFENDEDDEFLEGKGVALDLAPRSDPIIPTPEGFKAHARQLNPRLPTYMVDRISQEQVRRYKKLLDLKVRHIQAVKFQKCASKKHCLALGGEPTYLPSKATMRDSEVAGPGFSVAGFGTSDEDTNALAEGLVTPAQFPMGVPMPPVKRLPAEFECSLCFKAKKFLKPSDWSKHVHEDVQPFTCTFANCADPKSFKRKADWVRHENERHRQLEWWVCSMHDCSHKCFRKDNLVQHLVREHKLPEPKSKTPKASKPAVRGPSSQKVRKRKEDADSPVDEIDQVWRLVDECRGETSKHPREEPCRFCGNVCNSWKKLTVHLARHMEQIAMPILALAKQQEVSAETIISPIEQKAAPEHQASPSFADPLGPPDHLSGLPYPVPEPYYFSPTPHPQRHGQPPKPEAPPSSAYPRSGMATYPPATMAPASHAGPQPQMPQAYPPRGYATYHDRAASTYQVVDPAGSGLAGPGPGTDNLRSPGDPSQSTASHASMFPGGDGYSTYTTQPFQSPTEAPAYGFHTGHPQAYPPPGPTVHYDQMGAATYVPEADDAGLLYGSEMGAGPVAGARYPYS